MTLIELVREHCARRAQPRPAASAGSQDAGEAQYCALMNEMLDEVITRKAFKGVTKEKVHTTIASADQGNIFTLTDAGFSYIIPDTFWNRTSGLRVTFGLGEDEWQSRQVTGSISGPTYAARIRERNLWTNPVPPANQIWAFEYKTTFGVIDGSSSAAKQYFTRDDDTCFLADKVCLAWLNYAWKREKGFEHAAAERSFELILAEATATDKQTGPAHMAGAGSMRMGVIVAEGSWPL